MSEDSSIEFKQHPRGMYIYQFFDSYGNECSLQESSSIDPKIWLGIDKDPKGNRVGSKVKDHTGREVTISDRMHITQEQMIELLPLLQYFAEHGELPKVHNMSTGGVCDFCGYPFASLERVACRVVCTSCLSDEINDAYPSPHELGLL